MKVTEMDSPARQWMESRDGWNFQTAGLTRTQKDICVPDVMMVMMSPTKTMTQPQPPSG